MILSQGNKKIHHVIRHGLGWIFILTLSLFHAPEVLSQNGPGGVGNNTNNKLWLRADSVLGKSNGDPVDLWRDMSGNSNDFSQSVTTYRPLFQTNAINGFCALVLDGPGDFL